MANNWTSKVGDSFIYGAEQNGAYFSNSNYAVYDDPDLGGFNFRKGVRDGRYVRDKEIVVNGFSQLENIGWINIFSIN